MIFQRICFQTANMSPFQAINVTPVTKMMWFLKIQTTCPIPTPKPETSFQTWLWVPDAWSTGREYTYEACQVETRERNAM